MLTRAAVERAARVAQLKPSRTSAQSCRRSIHDTYLAVRDRTRPPVARLQPGHVRDSLSFRGRAFGRRSCWFPVEGLYFRTVERSVVTWWGLALCAKGGRVGRSEGQNREIKVSGGRYTARSVRPFLFDSNSSLKPACLVWKGRAVDKPVLSQRDDEDRSERSPVIRWSLCQPPPRVDRDGLVTEWGLCGGTDTLDRCPISPTCMSSSHPVPGQAPASSRYPNHPILSPPPCIRCPGKDVALLLVAATPSLYPFGTVPTRSGRAPRAGLSHQVRHGCRAGRPALGPDATGVDDLPYAC